MRKIIVACIMIVPLLFSIPLFAQTYGNPVATGPAGVFSVGLETGYIISPSETTEQAAYKALSRFEYNMTRDLNVSLLFGGARYFVRYEAEDMLTDFDGSFEFAYGAGIKINLWRPPGTSLRFFSGASFLSYQSLGNVQSRVDPDAVDIDFHFLLSEYRVFAGTIIPHNKLDFYCGFDFAQLKRKDKYTKEEFIPDMKNNIFAGVDYHLPERFFLNLQVRLLSDRAVMVGVGQSSKPVR